MDFIRKNWSRLSIALLFLLGGILGIVAFAYSGLFKDATGLGLFYYIAMLVSVVVYFFGMVCIMILKSCAGRKAVSCGYMIMGAIISILNIVLFAVLVLNDATNVINLIGVNAIDVFFRFIVVTLVFGFYPLIKGVTRFIEAEMTPAPVKAAAQPAATTTEAAPAPKATAKKTAAK